MGICSSTCYGGPSAILIRTPYVLGSTVAESIPDFTRAAATRRDSPVVRPAIDRWLASPWGKRERCAHRLLSSGPLYVRRARRAPPLCNAYRGSLRSAQVCVDPLVPDALQEYVRAPIGVNSHAVANELHRAGAC